ncbi:uncharacterized protein LOC129572381, partial [Sitodiplosis mosellana]|uniref:uncharacterized protein LOC129572381 n=1 Tax=Sitodiplosis mosellana TaxID=263140 RepID=UPI0024448417
QLSAQSQFEELYQKLKHRLQPKRMTRPDAITPRERLSYTLEYLAGGPRCERYLASTYSISQAASTVILRETCQIIYEELAATEFMIFTKENWLDVSSKFYEKWNMPNCVGAVDGKHVRIRCPANAGSLYFNYKRYHSVILMAACDAEYRFTFVDVGSPGQSDGDMNVFSRSTLGRDIFENSQNLNLPEDCNINGEKMPFFFVADDAFPLSPRIMKPYGGTLKDDERIFNYRLSCARRTIENAFGIMTMRWSCLTSEFLCQPDKVKVIVGACCALHNFLAKRSPTYVQVADRYDNHGNLIEGEWRRTQGMGQINLVRRGRPSTAGNTIRDRLKHFFNNINILSYQFDRLHFAPNHNSNAQSTN